MDFAKNTLFKSYDVDLLTSTNFNSFDGKEIRLMETIGRLAAILTPSHTTTRNYCTGLDS